MTEPTSLKGLAARMAALEHRLIELEGLLVDIQGEYSDASRELTESKSFARRLTDWGLKPADTATWMAVCDASEWVATTSNAHRVVRREDPVLHVLLHRCAFGEYCLLDSVTYSD
jgi:hypothetical protein